ncbi:695_t:CDS:2, partial [Gigaspora rosea]
QYQQVIKSTTTMATPNSGKGWKRSRTPKKQCLPGLKKSCYFVDSIIGFKEDSEFSDPDRSTFTG